ncbi:MAG: hypothetical protein WD317_00630 [Balneolaceae bacterium]
MNKIKASLNKSKINVSKFKTWEETQINATGLEIWIDLVDSTDYLKAVSINFDWDRFRETRIAKQLEGTEKHPLLKAPHLVESNVEPVIDIEVVWYFNERKCQPSYTGSNADNSNYRINVASQWMSSASKQVNELLLSDEIITRWHIEMEGDENGKYLTAINLISYFQYTLSDLDSLNNVHAYVERKIHHLLYKINRVIRIADSSVEITAA